MPLINTFYAYLVQKSEIKTGIIKEFSLFGETFYQLGHAPNSIFFTKNQLEDLLVTHTLVFSEALIF
jgi:hypothetical protein